jgi:hypothetical protein
MRRESGLRGSEVRVLLGCEESGTAREAFRKLGHNAWSNDLLPARDGSPFHLQMDVREAIKLRKWNLIVLFPPCTYTCLSGNGTWAGTPERQAGMEFTNEVWELAKSTGAKVALEQPKTMVGRMLGKPTQKVQLWWFGDGEVKETWLWMHNTKPLFADNPTDGREPKVHRESPGIKDGLTRAQRRQTLRPGFARALAEQLGGL